MTDQHADERRRNKAMSDWIRQGVSAPNQPLEVPKRLDELDERDAATGSPATPSGPPSVDAGAGTGGRRQAPEPSMNQMLRDLLASAPPGRRSR